jgi:hypothetical protein
MNSPTVVQFESKEDKEAYALDEIRFEKISYAWLFAEPR